MINRMNRIMTLATWAPKASPSIRMRKMFLTIAMLVCLPFSNPRPMKLFRIWHFCETRLFVSWTSRTLEQMFVIQIRKKKKLRPKWTWLLASLQQKMRPEIIQVFQFSFSSPSKQSCLSCFVWLIQALFHLLTGHVSILTVHSKSGLLVSATYRHVDPICAQTGANSPVETFRGTVVIFHAWRFRQLQC